jgi:hypothetical protein
MFPVPIKLTVILEFKTLDSIQGPSVGILAGSFLLTNLCSFLTDSGERGSLSVFSCSILETTNTAYINSIFFE